MKKLLQNNLLKFLLVGGISTLIDLLVYMLLSKRILIPVAKTISMLTSSVFSYFANKLFTFQDKHPTNINYLIRFYLVFGLNLIANVSVNSLCYSYLGLNKLIAFILATLAGMTVNYLGQRWYVFKVR